jgi:hypothetical protein
MLTLGPDEKVRRFILTSIYQVGIVLLRYEIASVGS